MSFHSSAFLIQVDVQMEYSPLSILYEPQNSYQEMKLYRRLYGLFGRKIVIDFGCMTGTINDTLNAM